MIGSKRRIAALFLMGEDFDESFALACLLQMRGLGIAVRLVGQTAGQLNGRDGLSVRPDTTLSSLLLETTYPAEQLLFLSGPRRCASTLLVDPRVHQLIGAVLQRGGWVASTSPLLREVVTSRRQLPLSQARRLIVLQGEPPTVALGRFLQRYAAPREQQA